MKGSLVVAPMSTDIPALPGTGNRNHPSAMFARCKDEAKPEYEKSLHSEEGAMVGLCIDNL
jgi:hypothetical protein